MVLADDPGTGLRLGQVYAGVSAANECAKRFSADALAAALFAGGVAVFIRSRPVE